MPIGHIEFGQLVLHTVMVHAARLVFSPAMHTRYLPSFSFKNSSQLCQTPSRLWPTLLSWSYTSIISWDVRSLILRKNDSSNAVMMSCWRFLPIIKPRIIDKVYYGQRGCCCFVSLFMIFLLWIFKSTSLSCECSTFKFASLVEYSHMYSLFKNR